MKMKELDAAWATLGRLLQAKGLESVFAQRIRTIQREIEILRKSGKIESKRLVRIVGLISEVACDALLK